MKVLVVEDELIVGMDLVMLLEEWGHTTSGPHSTPKAALDAVGSFDPDLALLDVNLGKNGNSRPVADALVTSGKAFAYLTGYGSARGTSSGALDGVFSLTKPIAEKDLKAFLDAHEARVNSDL